MADTWHVVIIETPLFTRQITALVADADYASFQIDLIRNPEMGDLLKGGGGIRKVRLRLPGRGKSSGGRVIYYWARDAARIYMLVAYAKNVSTDLTPGQISVLKDLVKELD